MHLLEGALGWQHPGKGCPKLPGTDEDCRGKRERSLSLSGFLCFQTIGLGYFSHPLSVSLWRDDPSMPVFRGFRLPVVSVFPWDKLCLVRGVVSWFPRWCGFQGSHAISMLKVSQAIQVQVELS